MKEIEMAMVRVGAIDKFFKFKTLTPIYPTMFQKLTDHDYWTKFEWTFEKSMAQEKMKQNNIKLILNEFQHNHIFEKDEIRKRHRRLPDEFDMDHTYLKKLVFRDDNYEAGQYVEGKLWLRELFMKAQTNIL